MARDDESSLPSWLALLGGRNIGLGRHWHGLVTVLWVANGLLYVGLLFLTGQWRRIVPTSWDVIPSAWESLKVYAGFSIPGIEHFTPLRLAATIDVLHCRVHRRALMLATGPAMSPALIGRHPWYAKMFGGRQAARSLHFLGMASLTFFTVMHIALVFVVHPDHNLPQMMFGVDDPARFAQALTVCLIGIATVVAAWLAISYLSLVDVRKTQRFLFVLLEPIRAVTVNRMVPRTRRAHTYTEKDISPYHWSNGRHPTPEESPEWTALAQDGFSDYVMQIGGLTSHPVRVTLDELKALPQQEQIAMHTCMQGWTGIAKWKGPKVMDVMSLAGERDPQAAYLMVTSSGLAQKMHGGRPLEPYYSCIPLADCLEDESIFAWSMNDQPLPLTFGAPLRLRVKSIHGYKMVKYIHSLEWIRDYRVVGDGMGGTREDSGYQAINARI